MRGRMKYFVLLVPLIFMPMSGFSVRAEETAAPSAESAPHGNETDQEWNGECPERQEIREERERIRAEAEALETEHDRIKTQCMDSKGQQLSECREKWKDFAARRAALHERHRALKEKAEAEPDCHHAPKDDQKGSWPERKDQPPVAESK